mmetsp:Transcript_30097/g.97631  ORF Transcript_30097/g.97631 Transcript_30097/m.97631 type:complete len:185 (+) Transcript_30097:1128-1682(+)
MTSQAAKYAALASVELKGLDDVQWYVGALSTWCAAAISYIESGSENGARAELGTFIVRRYAQAWCLCLSVFPDVKRQPGTGRYLLCCVCDCAKQRCDESTENQEIALLEFVDVLVGIISDNASPSAGGLGSIEATRVAMAAALICGRAGCVRKAAALVAIAASSHSMFGRNQVIQFYIWVHVTL